MINIIRTSAFEYFIVSSKLNKQVYIPNGEIIKKRCPVYVEKHIITKKTLRYLFQNKVKSTKSADGALVKGFSLPIEAAS